MSVFNKDILDNVMSLYLAGNSIDDIITYLEKETQKTGIRSFSIFQ